MFVISDVWIHQIDEKIIKIKEKVLMKHEKDLRRSKKKKFYIAIKEYPIHIPLTLLI